MAGEGRERLAALLRELNVPGSFSARKTAPVDDLHLEVRGIERLSFPVPPEQATQLCEMARPARYGRESRRCSTVACGDTSEIPRSRVKIDKRRWSKTLMPVLDAVRHDLGLPSGCRLEAELHSMLVYARGQFFLPHQDSEKSDEMVGSLVVTLPSPFTGGSLVIEHEGQRATYRGSKAALSFVAFYGDCRHEVRPVRSGHRIGLTYNLLLHQTSTEPPAPDASPESVEELARLLEEHFSTPPPPRWPNTAQPTNLRAASSTCSTTGTPSGVWTGYACRVATPGVRRCLALDEPLHGQGVGAALLAEGLGRAQPSSRCASSSPCSRLV